MYLTKSGAICSLSFGYMTKTIIWHCLCLRTLLMTYTPRVWITTHIIRNERRIVLLAVVAVRYSPLVTLISNRKC
jgi:hypothetical protein